MQRRRSPYLVVKRAYIVLVASSVECAPIPATQAVEKTMHKQEATYKRYINIK